MLGQRLQERAELDGDGTFLYAPSGVWDYLTFFRQSQRLAKSLSTSDARVVGTYLPDSVGLLLVMTGATLAGISVAILDRNYTVEQLTQILPDLALDILVVEEESDVPSDIDVSVLPMGRLAGNDDSTQFSADAFPVTNADESGELIILTSGTTGRPKCARYHWSNLLGQVRITPEASGQRWLFAYHMNHFAGIQMVLHALLNGASLILPESARVGDALNAASEFNATHVSATPTFWRFALNLFRSGHVPVPDIEHITLGSEAVTEAVLDQLRTQFPTVSISQIYAATEIGSCVSVNDGRVGLPLSVLDRSEDSAVRFKVVDDELWVSSRHGMTGYLKQTEEDAGAGSSGNHGWRATGDMVRLTEDRILFVGRKSETVNVGGVKIHPLEVEAVVEKVNGVKLVRALGQPNPIMGEVVSLQVVPEDGFDTVGLEEAIREASRVLGRHGQPKVIDFLPELKTSNGKLWRGREQDE